MDYIAVLTWIIAVLKAYQPLVALVGGNIYRNLIPQGVALPAVRIDLITSRTTRWSTGARALTRASIQIAACTQGDDAQLPATIFQAIDQAIDRQICRTGTLTAKIVRDMLVDSSEAVDGERFNLLGARYRCIFYQPDLAVSQNAMPIVLQTFDTSAGNITQSIGGAAGNGQAYQYTNLGPGTVTLNFAGSDTSGESSNVTIEPYGSITLASYAIGSWSIIMAFEPSTPTGINPKIAITATGTLSLPAQDTDYDVSAASADITTTLPATTGSGVAMHFDIESLSTYTWTVDLHGSDAYEGGASLPALVSGASFTLRDIAAGTWAIE